MGGNALKNTETRRYLREEYDALAQDVFLKLCAYFPSRRKALVPAYRTKADFGDMDILMVVDNLTKDWVDRVQDVFSPKEIVKSFSSMEAAQTGDVLNFEYRDFQIDLILTGSDEFDFALNYYSWNDLGNLVGKVSRGLKFKFGHNGLWYSLFDNGNFVEKILVTQDYDKALQFLGYDPKRFNQGFDTLEDIFDYVTTSRYFNPAAFLPENLTHRDRMRERKRPTYHNFISRLPNVRGIPSESFSEQRESRAQHAFNRAQTEFPDFKKAYDEALQRFSDAKTVKTKFNGQLVSEVTGLTGKALGAVMENIRRSFANESVMRNFMLNATREEIEELIRRFAPQQRQSAISNQEEFLRL